MNREEVPSPGTDSGTDPPATLNPSIVGQAEKAHAAILKRVLSGTALDEPQWITWQVAVGAGDKIQRTDLISFPRVPRRQVQRPSSRGGDHCADQGISGRGACR